MNWAFSAVLFILFVFPGLTFRIAYLSSPYGKRKLATSIADEAVFAILPAFFIQIVLRWFCNTFLSSFSGWLISPSIALRLINLEKADPTILTNVDGYFSLFVLHLLIAVTVGVLLGWSSMKIVRRYKLDSKLPWLRTENKWYYTFNIGGKNIFTFIDALVKTSEGEMIYTGIVRDFDPGPSDSLEGIYVDNVKRRLLKNDAAVLPAGSEHTREEPSGSVSADTDNGENYYSIPGEYFYISFKNIVNLNIQGFKLAESR